jgi:hypothetical protein
VCYALAFTNAARSTPSVKRCSSTGRSSSTRSASSPSLPPFPPAHAPQTDKLGRPINIHRFGGINAPELNKLVGPERFDGILTVNCEALTREILPACAVAAGTRIETVLVIVDLKGFGCGRHRHGRLGAAG